MKEVLLSIGIGLLAVFGFIFIKVFFLILAFIVAPMAIFALFSGGAYATLKENENKRKTNMQNINFDKDSYEIVAEWKQKYDVKANGEDFDPQKVFNEAIDGISKEAKKEERK